MGKTNNIQYLDVLWIYIYLLFTYDFTQGLVMAGLADMARPAEKLSTSQSFVLTATGIYRNTFSKTQHFDTTQHFEDPNLPHSVFRSYLVQVFPGYYPEELESICCKLLCRRCRRITALQNMEVRSLIHF